MNTAAGNDGSAALGDESQMLEYGAALGRALTPGLVIYLVGDLGAGKTTLARGVLRALGHQGAVKSPTYTLVEPYELATLTVHHFDLYRLGDPEELEFMGIRDYFFQGGVALIEWPERGEGFLPRADLIVRIEREGQGRRLWAEAQSEAGLRCLSSAREGLAVTGDSGVK